MEEFVAKHAGPLIGAVATLAAAVLATMVAVYLARRKHRTASTNSSTTTHQTASRSGSAAQVGHARDVTINQGADTGSIAEGIARGLAKAHLGRFADYEAQLRDKETEIAALESAVEALQVARDSADAPPGIDEALTQLEAGDTAKAEEIFRRVFERRRAEGQGAFKEAAAASRHLGALAFLHDTDAALRAYAHAVELDPDDAEGWNQLGHLRDRTGNLDGAAEAYERVLRLGNAVDDKSLIAVAYGNRGLIYMTRGDLDAAEEHFQISLALNVALGRKEGMARDYGNLGVIHRTRGDLDAAEEHIRKSLGLNEELGRKEGVARQYGNLGTIYSTRGDLDTAEEFHRKSLALSEELGRKEGMANQYGNLGLIYLTRGDHDTAEENFRNSLALNVELGRKVGMANDYGNLGQVLRERGDLAEACRLWAKAKRLFEDVGAAPEVAQIQGWMDGHGCGGNAA